MSLITSFYLFHIADCGALISAAEFVPPKKKFLGLIPQKKPENLNLFWETIQSKGKELEEFEASGFAFADLFAMYPEFEGISNSELGQRLSTATESTYLSFSKDEVQQALSVLGDRPPSVKEIQAFLATQEGSDESMDWALTIQDAWKILKQWLSQIEEEKIGLLSIG